MYQRIVRYLLWTVVLSIPLWLAATAIDATQVIPIKFPLSALQFLSAFAAALIVARNSRNSMQAFLARGLDFSRVQGSWRIWVFALMPCVVGTSWVVGQTSLGGSVASATPPIAVLLFLPIYALSGYCEQMGWTAVMTDDLLDAGLGVVASGLLVGAVWAAWHVVPFIQTHNAPLWILGQCLYTIVYRVLLTKVYLITNRSVFSTIALHATYNTAFSMLPHFGSGYNPWTMAACTLVVTLAMLRIPYRPQSVDR